jgi:hypothetical protein
MCVIILHYHHVKLQMCGHLQVLLHVSGNQSAILCLSSIASKQY